MSRFISARLVRPALTAAFFVAAMMAAVRLQFGVSEIHRAESPRNFPLATAPITTDDWPAFRGPNGDGSVARDAFPAAIGVQSRITWHADVPGVPLGGPCVRSGLVHLSVVDPLESSISLAAWNVDDGQLAWQTVLHRNIAVSPNAPPAVAAPAGDGDAVFLGAVVNSRLLAFAVERTGRLRWTCDAGPMRAENGKLVSPLLHESLVIVPGDHRGTRWQRWMSTGHLTAIHRQTGEIIWRIRRPNVDYAVSPVLARIADRTRLVAAAPGRICGYDPANGKLIWSKPCDATRFADAVAWDNERLFLAPREPRSLIVALSADALESDAAAAVLWQSELIGGAVSLVRVADCVIALTEDGALTSLDAASGRRNWRRQLPGTYVVSPLVAGDELLCLNQQGSAAIVHVRQSGKVIAEWGLGDGAVAPPAATRRQLFLRTSAGLLSLPWDGPESPLVNAPDKPRQQL